MQKPLSRLITVVSMAFALETAVSCSGISGQNPQGPSPKLQERGQHFDGTYYHDLPTEGWEMEVMNRAKLLLNTSWTPLAAVPKYSSGSYVKGTLYKGMPYSGVSDTYGVIGQHISIYTFLSAVSNPKSNLYKVDYRGGSGDTACCYYGTVCSTAFFYAWGLPTCSLGTDRAKSIYLTKKDSNRIEDLELLDGMYYRKEGVGAHYMLITDVARDKDGALRKVTVWESQTPVVHETTYTPSELQARFERFGAPVYFYQVKPQWRSFTFPDYMEEGPEIPAYTFPRDLCTERGDKVTIALGESIKINVLSSGYRTLELFKDETLVRTVTLNGTQDVELSALSTGLYKARLATEGKCSDFTYFEVGDPNFSVSCSSSTLTLRPSGHKGIPLYITMNDADNGWGRPVEKGPGEVYTYTGDLGTATHVRIHFAGKYGAYKGNSVKFR